MTDQERKAIEVALEELEWEQCDILKATTSKTIAIKALRQALVQPEQGEVVVTKNSQGQIVAVTRQDEEGRILKTIATSAQPEQEPVAWLWLHQGEPVNALMFNPSDKDEHFKKKGFSSKPLYTAPPSKQWVGLTDEDTANICMQSDLNNWLDEQVIDAVEAKLKEKNA